MFGHESASIPERLGAGCPANTFGYPCFRDDAIPIVVLFTDDPMNNGPPVYTAHERQLAGDLRRELHAQRQGADQRHRALHAASGRGVRDRVQPRRRRATSSSIAGGDLTVHDAATTRRRSPAAARRRRAGRGLPLHGQPRQRATTRADVRDQHALRSDSATTQPNYSTATTRASPATDVPVGAHAVPRHPDLGAAADQRRRDARQSDPVRSGPHLPDLLGTSAGTNSRPAGFLGGISGCGADGKTNEVVFTFRPTANAHIVIDASESGFDTVVSLHEGLPEDLPPNPTARRVQLRRAGATTTTRSRPRSRSTAATQDRRRLRHLYRRYLAAAEHRRGDRHDQHLRRHAGLDDYERRPSTVPPTRAGRRGVQFRVAAETRLRIDTEGSLANTLRVAARRQPRSDRDRLPLRRRPEWRGGDRADLDAGYVLRRGQGRQRGPDRQVPAQRARRDRARSTTSRSSAPATTDRIMAAVMAGQDYTVLLRGRERFEQGAYSLKLYDPTGLMTMPAGAWIASRSARTSSRTGPAAQSALHARPAPQQRLHPHARSRHVLPAVKGAARARRASTSCRSATRPRARRDPVRAADLDRGDAVLDSSGAKILPVLSCIRRAATTRATAAPRHRGAGARARARVRRQGRQQQSA